MTDNKPKDVRDLETILPFFQRIGELEDDLFAILEGNKFDHRQFDYLTKLQTIVGNISLILDGIVEMDYINTHMFERDHPHGPDHDIKLILEKIRCWINPEFTGIPYSRDDAIAENCPIYETERGLRLVEYDYPEDNAETVASMMEELADLQARIIRLPIEEQEKMVSMFAERGVDLNILSEEYSNRFVEGLRDIVGNTKGNKED